jgi:hypothetical protein
MPPLAMNHVNTAGADALLNWSSASQYLDIDGIPFAASASDPDGYIDRVEFWANGSKLGESPASPYSLAWPAPHNPGSHNIHARAFDLSGLSTSTPAINVQTTLFRLAPVQVQKLSNPSRQLTTLQFTLPAIRAYTIQRSTDLTSWENIHTGTGTGSVISLSDQSSSPHCYYRLLVDSNPN